MTREEKEPLRCRLASPGSVLRSGHSQRTKRELKGARAVLDMRVLLGLASALYQCIRPVAEGRSAGCSFQSHPRMLFLISHRVLADSSKR